MRCVWYAAVLSRAAAIAPCSALQHLSTTAARANASLQEETPSERRSRFVGVFQRFRARSPTTNRTLASGAGSTLAYTNRTRHTLETVLRAHGIRSLLDVPCGDFAWMPHLLARHPELRYFGGELVEELVDEHRARFARLPQWRFGVVDMAVGLPAEPRAHARRAPAPVAGRRPAGDSQRERHALRRRPRAVLPLLATHRLPPHLSQRPQARGRAVGLGHAPVQPPAASVRPAAAARSRRRGRRLKTLALYALPLPEAPRADPEDIARLPEAAETNADERELVAMADMWLK